MTEGARVEIALEGVSKSFDGGASYAVEQVSFEVRSGELLALIGESGSGKTTLLKMINRLVDPDAGRITFGGVDLRERDPIELRRSIGWVIQGAGLFPHRTVEENVRTVPDLLGWSRARSRERVAELLSLVGLEPARYAKRAVTSLSGGEQQRVGFARALAGDPAILLLDEPFGALDPITRDRLQADFGVLQRTLRRTAVLVTHDVTLALLLADRIAVLRRSKLLRLGTPAEVLHDPRDPYVESLLQMPLRRTQELDALLARSRSENGA